MEFVGGMQLLLLLLLRVANAANASPPSSPAADAARCPATCGNLNVPYPFGLRPGCARAPDFNLTCDETTNPPRTSVFGMQVLEVLVGQGQLRVTTGQDMINGANLLASGRYSVSEESAVLNWVVDHVSCNDAVKNTSTYACVSSNSLCHDDINATFGYHCECSHGYQGNPYISNGCQDIDECLNPAMYKCYGICNNFLGGYSCICPPDTFGDPIKGLCLPHKQRSLVIYSVIVGVSTIMGSIILLLSGAYFYKRWKERNLKKMKEKYFHTNRGFLLQQLISSHEDIDQRTKIFSLEEIEKATNNFDESRILGHGGHGTVYKGILSDQRVVAIKKSKIAVQREIDQFLNEVVILSHISHRNVVKLFGCCLETQVPLLVYEFISNGTLYDQLHAGNCSFILSWEDRLRIAAEVAGALAYLHSAASISIFHRDVKTSNILLDDNCTTKVSDFGASRSIPLDQTRITTVVQGTFGYLDPEYFHTSQLTEKSDVYSFGVILVELLTGEKPVSLTRFEEERNLATHFICSLKESRLFQIIESSIMQEGIREEIEVVAKLAEMCLRLRGEERPTMKEVEMHLDKLRRSKRHETHPWSTQIHKESQSLLSETYTKCNATDGTRQYSIEREFLLSMEYPR